jgi:hypothetical protein
MKPLVALALACFALAGCASTPDVHTDHDPAVNFGAYHTYYWAQPPELANPLVQQRIVAGIDARLRAKGWTRSEDIADIALVANVATSEKQTLDTFYSGGSMGRWGYYGAGGWGGVGMGSATTRVNTYTVGTLVVDMFDAATKKAVWRGTASATVPDSPQKVDTQVNAALDKMFADFPPGSAAAK